MLHYQNSEKPRGKGNQNIKYTLHSLERFTDVPVAGSVSLPDQNQLTRTQKISFEPELFSQVRGHKEVPTQSMGIRSKARQAASGNLPDSDCPGLWTKVLKPDLYLGEDWKETKIELHPRRHLDT